MLTRCPKCRTAFRVTSEQLKARQGRVRCGECQEVFNALDTLIEASPPLAASPATMPAPAVAEPPPEPEVAAPAAHAVAEPSPMAEEYAPTRTAPVEVEAAVPAAVGMHIEAEAGAMPAEAPAAPPGDDEPLLEPLLHEEPARRSWPWAIGMAAALLALVAQAAVLFRTEVAILYPGTRPALAAACGMLDCELSLPRKPDLVGIETSDLHPETGGRLTLTAALRNRAPFAQEYPHLELSLTDTSDQPLVRRVLAPGEYLPPDTPLAAGFKAHADLTISLAVEAPDIPAVGYRLYLFYP